MTLTEKDIEFDYHGEKADAVNLRLIRDYIISMRADIITEILSITSQISNVSYVTLYDGADLWRVSMNNSGAIVTTLAGIGSADTIFIHDEVGGIWSLTINTSGALITTNVGSAAAALELLSTGGTLYEITIDSSDGRIITEVK